MDGKAFLFYAKSHVLRALNLDKFLKFWNHKEAIAKQFWFSHNSGMENDKTIILVSKWSHFGQSTISLIYFVLSHIQPIGGIETSIC